MSVSRGQQHKEISRPDEEQRQNIRNGVGAGRLTSLVLAPVTGNCEMCATAPKHKKHGCHQQELVPTPTKRSQKERKRHQVSGQNEGKREEPGSIPVPCAASEQNVLPSGCSSTDVMRPKEP